MIVGNRSCKFFEKNNLYIYLLDLLIIVFCYLFINGFYWVYFEENRLFGNLIG